jgi:hypothetical protein
MQRDTLWWNNLTRAHLAIGISWAPPKEGTIPISGSPLPRSLKSSSHIGLTLKKGLKDPDASQIKSEPNNPSDCSSQVCSREYLPLPCHHNGLLWDKSDNCLQKGITACHYPRPRTLGGASILIGCSPTEGRSHVPNGCTMKEPHLYKRTAIVVGML